MSQSIGIYMKKYHNVTLTFDDLIIFLDDDKTNFNKENLYKVSRAVGGIMVGDCMAQKKSAKQLLLSIVNGKKKIKRS